MTIAYEYFVASAVDARTGKMRLRILRRHWKGRLVERQIIEAYGSREWEKYTDAFVRKSAFFESRNKARQRKAEMEREGKKPKRKR